MGKGVRTGNLYHGRIDVPDTENVDKYVSFWLRNCTVEELNADNLSMHADLTSLAANLKMVQLSVERRKHHMIHVLRVESAVRID